MTAQDIKLTLTHSDSMMDEWYLIERAEHSGRRWFEQTQYGTTLMNSARITDADIEGTKAEMLALAWAIERGQSEHFKRCAAEYTPDGYLLSSPRNSSEPALICHERAKELAAEIRAKLGAPKP